jgi:hypothetical protein
MRLIGTSRIWPEMSYPPSSQPPPKGITLKDASAVKQASAGAAM